MKTENLNIFGYLTSLVIDRYRIAYLFFILIILGGWFAYTLLPRESKPEVVVPLAFVTVEYPGASPMDVEALVTNKVELALREIEDVEYYSIGSIQAGRVVSVTSKISGQQINAIHVTAGDKVHRSELLFSLESDDLQNQMQRELSKLDNEIAMARIAMEEAEESYLISLKLYETGSLTKNSLDGDKYKFDQNRLLYEQAINTKQTELDLLSQSLEDTRIYAPIDGLIAELNFEEGELIGNDSKVVIIDIDTVIIETQVSEKIINSVKIGQEARIIVPALRSTELTGTISKISLITGQTSRFELTLELPNPEGLLKPGMHAEVYLDIDTLTDRIIIPKTSLLSDRDSSYVFRVDPEENLAEKVEVEKLMTRGMDTLVSGDLQEGDILVVKGQHYLSDGSLVQIME